MHRRIGEFSGKRRVKSLVENGSAEVKIKCTATLSGSS